ncbi:MAG: LytTR family DNA-binding domain-containing protein [Bacteroidales bacterium]|nr:LytTR family DNA-binding domain-containing protein [Bacteroidales bacterium]MCF8456926.1 LytTR family DNA-binding domain-containing protein [Bacteroidales bacterium]
MGYKAIIVDDERKLRETLELLLAANCPEITVCGSVGSAREAREMLVSCDVDFIFLDISMPHEDGFAFLRTIPKENYAIIITTAHSEYAIKAIRANAIDYLLKPVNVIELKDAVTKAIQYHELRKRRNAALKIYHESLDNLQEQIQSGQNTITKITVPIHSGFNVVKLAELMYLQADSNYTILHFSGLSKIVATCSLQDFEKMLACPEFFRIHRSTIINLNYLKSYSSFPGNYVELTDGTKLSISRIKMSEFKEAVSRYSKSLE